MEHSLKQPLAPTLNRWRGKVKTFAGNTFTPPYLPSRFIWFFLLTDLTNLAIVLMNYSPYYWNDSLQTKGAAPILVNETSPVNLLLTEVAYLSVALFCLTVFNYRWSLAGWFSAEVYHFWSINTWLDGCTYGRWSRTLGALCESFDDKVYWIIVAVLLGMLAATYLHPGADSIPREQLKKKTPRVSVVFAAAWGLLLFLGMVVPSAQTPTSGWIPLELDISPPPLQGAVHAYDTKHNKLILFGGVTGYINGRWVYKNETWEWDGKQWRNVSPPPNSSPHPRVSGGMAYDENRDVFVLYGGAGESGPLCDTWEWDGERWIRFCPPNCPGQRYGHEMFYNAARKKVVLYGGYDNKTFFNDAWEWDGYTWTKIEIEGDSPTASLYALAYNPDENFVFGLLSGTGGTWTYKDNHWTRLSTTAEPSNRGGMRLVYEPERKVFVTFGGFSNNLSLNDTWFFDGKSWNLFTDTNFQPPVRTNMVMWYDRVRKHVMLFGGGNDTVVYGDTWELNFP